MNTCSQCDQQIRDGEKIWWAGRDELAHRNCLATAIARAEAAEKRVAELEAAAADWYSQAIGIDNMLDDEIRETVALRARVAELEAELSRISGRLSATEAVMDEFEELMGIND